MVYCGKPSRACHACRARRIKSLIDQQCDRQQPTCSQCKRMTIVCPGYRNSLDQDFRDESRSVAKKAQASYMSKAKNCGCEEGIKMDAPRAKTTLGLGTPPPDDHGSTYDSLMWRSLPEPIQDVAIAHLMSSYIPGSHFDYVPAIYIQSPSQSPLVSTLNAVSLAIISQELNQPSLEVAARNSYAIALTYTNTALAYQCTAIQDATLISVLLLSLFEAVVCPDIHTPESWTTHTRGALTILHLRGQQQLDTELGRALFLQVTNIILVHCIQKKRSLPPALSHLMSTARTLDGTNPKLGLTILTSEVIETRAVLDNGQYTPLQHVEAVICIDRKCASFASSLPTTWRYTTASIDEPRPEVYSQTYHQYPSKRVAQLWSSWRMLRILLNEHIHEHAGRLQNGVSRARIQAQAAANVQRMATDICASIPQFTHPAEFGPVNPCVPAQAFVSSLLWPLSAVRGASLAPESASRYAVQRLQYLGEQFGMPHAERVSRCSLEIDALGDGLHMLYVS